MRLTTKLLCRLTLMLSTIIPLACDQALDPSGSLDTAAETDEYDAELEQRIAEGWHDFEEPIGDESYAEARLTPKEPLVGQPAKLVFIAGSYYGVPVGVKVWARAGDPNTPVDWQNPSDSPAWIEMKPVSAQVFEEDDTPREVAIDYNYPGEIQGQIRFEAELTLPAGESPVEFKIDPAYEGSQIMAFEGWRVTASEE